MATKHLESHLLAAWVDGELELDRLMELLLRHLHDHCSVCRLEIEAFVRRRNGFARPSPGGGRAPALPPRSIGAARSLAHECRHARILERSARRQLERLLRLEPEERTEPVHDALLAFRNPHLARMLVERSLATVASDPREAGSLARLAEEIAERLPARYGEDLRRSLRLRARACSANALRVEGDLRGAQAMLGELLERLEEVIDPLLQAELLSIGSLLRKDQRRPGEAEELLVEALGIYRRVGTARQVAETRLRLASLRYHRGRVDEAVEILRELAAGSSRGVGPALWHYAQHNLALYLCEMGRYEKARETFEELVRARGGPDATLQGLRLQWLEGKISAGLGESGRAESRFCRVREGFLDAGVGTDAAQVSLDLAMLYLEQGRTAEVKALAGEMMTLFRAQDIHREAVAAFLLFQRACTEETVTLDMLRELHSQLERSRGRSPLSNERPS